MQRVTAKKDVVNNGEYRAAVQGYAACLLDLMPWYASPLLFTARHAYDTGIVHLVLKATTLPVMNRLDLGILAFETVNWMRYAPSKALYKARYVKSHDEYEQFSSIPAAREMTDVMRECAEEMSNKDKDEWAHRFCFREHVCFTPRYLLKIRTWEREQVRLQNEGPNPLDDLE
ncbi:hypothetical protein A1Q2_02736 [Trichosporon asahii var. asahii CBS 8904]|uniref:Uncharacterized protein n=2 Tax=Trichosporon asahii var. asahii TaxID=189963 RepID=K1VFT6_TRIAC|nr:hypothetical protein A1Q2_02736 [Trichosporon asahii var. asahii CBS 8904]